MEEPLLAERGSEKWSSAQYGPILNSSFKIAGPGTSGLSIEEIRSASMLSSSSSSPLSSNQHPYPPSIHGALLSSPQPLLLNLQAIASQDPYGEGLDGNILREVGRQILDEIEIRELLIDHVGHRCCVGSRPARTWKISAVEDCNVYVGTLETFVEERDTVRETEPYLGGKIDGKDQGPELGVWELNLREDIPLLFISIMETRKKIPHSEAVSKCSGCQAWGGIPCPTCNVGEEPGFYKENQMTQCPVCYGRGLVAHSDGSDTICTNCGGKGKLPCVTCGSRGLLKCQKCHGEGSLLTYNVAAVRWRTLSNRKMIATRGAASVPEEVFHRAGGVKLCNIQAYQCTPVYFGDALLNKFSADVIAERSPIPPTARVISERHTVSVVPVTRVTMAHRDRSFSFYIIGLKREVYIKDYPSQPCWGLCPCLEWLGLV